MFSTSYLPAFVSSYNLDSSQHAFWVTRVAIFMSVHMLQACTGKESATAHLHVPLATHFQAHDRTGHHLAKAMRTSHLMYVAYISIIGRSLYTETTLNRLPET